MARWRLLGLVLSVVGFVDAIYLLTESLYPNTPLYCPTSGAINCALVTSSSFSKLFGVPVAGLGAAFFAGMVLLLWIDNPTLNYLLIPLWGAGVAFVGYLVYAEVFVLGAVCLYCTLDHVIALLLGLPAFKLALAEET